MDELPAKTPAQLLVRPSSKPLLICFSHLRWGFVWQRPQHLLSRAAREYRVLFVEEPLFAPVKTARLDLSEGPGAVTVAVPILPEGTSEPKSYAMRRRLLDKLLAKIGDRPLICWYYTPMALPFADHLAPAVTVYDCMDELSAFRGAPRPISLLERELFAKADVVFTGGRSLYELKRSQHRNVHCFPSSIDAEHFARARKIDEPDPGDQASIPRPRFGFFGVVDERMDLELVRRLAELQPDWQLVMIGPVVKIDAAELPRARNIHWLGSKKYEELPSYLSGWNAGIMPFALNEATRFISPTKTPEFLAAGLPVVSTPIRDVVRLYGNAGFVEIAGSAEDFVSKLKILLDRPRAEWRARVDDHLRSTSWDKTWAGMHARIRAALASRRSPSLAEARTSLTAAAEVARV